MPEKQFKKNSFKSLNLPHINISSKGIDVYFQNAGKGYKTIPKKNFNFWLPPKAKTLQFSVYKKNPLIDYLKINGSNISINLHSTTKLDFQLIEKYQTTCEQIKMSKSANTSFIKNKETKTKLKKSVNQPICGLKNFNRDESHKKRQTFHKSGHKISISVQNDNNVIDITNNSYANTANQENDIAVNKKMAELEKAGKKKIDEHHNVIKERRQIMKDIEIQQKNLDSFNKDNKRVN
ncbi:hypothetical protein A3Q56_06309 [Intoshia linei]|uniref:Uncharacterized protein n=1 Tax=Intoshia linei TaxID=1819745 RepID=A0A177AVD2_9BILA|nr:hypothetical protein A3Q56_06309 [Intoshia linei]